MPGNDAFQWEEKRFPEPVEPYRMRPAGRPHLLARTQPRPACTIPDTGPARHAAADWRDHVGSANADTLQQVGENTDLDFFGVDFTLDDDGRLFPCEPNPAMRHSHDHARNFPCKQPYDAAPTRGFTAMVNARIVAMPAAT